jgi:hypothetical protein
MDGLGVSERYRYTFVTQTAERLDTHLANPCKCLVMAPSSASTYIKYGSRLFEDWLRKIHLFIVNSLENDCQWAIPYLKESSK